MWHTGLNLTQIHWIKTVIEGKSNDYEAKFSLHHINNLLETILQQKISFK